MSGSYKDLRAWRQAVDLALQLHVYHCTRMFSKDELYGLTSQMRMAAVSVASNIAEGKGRSSDKELIAFLHIRTGLSAGARDAGPTRTESQLLKPLWRRKTDEHG